MYHTPEAVLYAVVNMPSQSRACENIRVDRERIQSEIIIPPTLSTPSLFLVARYVFPPRIHLSSEGTLYYGNRHELTSHITVMIAPCLHAAKLFFPSSAVHERLPPGPDQRRLEGRSSLDLVC